MGLSLKKPSRERSEKRAKAAADKLGEGEKRIVAAEHRPAPPHGGQPVRGRRLGVSDEASGSIRRNRSMAWRRCWPRRRGEAGFRPFPAKHLAHLSSQRLGRERLGEARQ